MLFGCWVTWKFRSDEFYKGQLVKNGLLVPSSGKCGKLQQHRTAVSTTLHQTSATKKKVHHPPIIEAKRDRVNFQEFISKWECLCVCVSALLCVGLNPADGGGPGRVPRLSPLSLPLSAATGRPARAGGHQRQPHPAHRAPHCTQSQR